MAKSKHLRSLSSLYLLLSAAVFLYISSASANKVGETCNTDSDCDSGLHCDGCTGLPSKCVRLKPLDPKSKDKGQPFNMYSWLTTHNSFALRGQPSMTGTPLIAPTNQLDTITSQLNNGVRGLMLDMYDFLNDIWLCHSFGGQCYNFTAFQPAMNVLKEIQTFLEANPSEVITIFIEDYVTSPNGITKVFNASGLMKYWFPVSEMPKTGNDWPLLSDMINKNHRLIVFTSKRNKEASEGIAYEWSYVVENQYGDHGMIAGSCPNRAESQPMSTKSRSLVLMNYFLTTPNATSACADNSNPLAKMLETCATASGNRYPNFVAVDFYTKSNGGGVQEAIDVANGHLLCGCDNLAYCKANGTFGSCDVPPPSDSSPSSNTPSSTIRDTSSATKQRNFFNKWWLIGMLLV